MPNSRHPMEFWATDLDYRRLVAIHIRQYVMQDGEPKELTAKSLEFVDTTATADGPVDPYDAAIRIQRNEAQALMDELWRIGLRPTEGSGSAGSLAATQEHLRDMRSIVAKQLDVVLDKPKTPNTR